MSSNKQLFNKAYADSKGTNSYWRDPKSGKVIAATSAFKTNGKNSKLKTGKPTAGSRGPKAAAIYESWMEPDKGGERVIERVVERPPPEPVKQPVAQAEPPKKKSGYRYFEEYSRGVEDDEDKKKAEERADAAERRTKEAEQKSKQEKLAAERQYKEAEDKAKREKLESERKYKEGEDKARKRAEDAEKRAQDAERRAKEATDREKKAREDANKWSDSDYIHKRPPPVPKRGKSAGPRKKANDYDPDEMEEGVIAARPPSRPRPKSPEEEGTNDDFVKWVMNGKDDMKKSKKLLFGNK